MVGENSKNDISGSTLRADGSWVFGLRFSSGRAEGYAKKMPETVMMISERRDFRTKL
jgi:hypothetical protein